MKKILFFAVSAIIAGVSFCSSVGERLSASISNESKKIEQQKEQLLVLEATSDECTLLASNSHRSHYSHSSHRSHYSHYSSR